MKNEKYEDFQEEIVPGNFGSFKSIMVKVIAHDDWHYPKSPVTIQNETLPEANGYWNIHGREHRIFYKKKLIAILHTEDCGLGSSKARFYLQQIRGFKIA